MTPKSWRSSQWRRWHRRRWFYRFLFFGACSPLVIQTVNAQASPALSDDVGNYVRSEMQRERIPGVALLVSRGGKIVQAQGFGFANVELQVPVKPDTVFQSGSVGKQFAATAVMMLVEEGKVGLNDPLTKYFP